MQNKLHHYLHCSKMSVCYGTIEQLPFHDVYVCAIVEENLIRDLLCRLDEKKDLRNHFHRSNMSMDGRKMNWCSSIPLSSIDIGFGFRENLPNK